MDCCARFALIRTRVHTPCLPSGRTSPNVKAGGVPTPWGASLGLSPGTVSGSPPAARTRYQVLDAAAR